MLTYAQFSTHMHKYGHTCTHTNTHAHVCTHMHTCAPTCTDTNRYAPICTDRHRNAPKCTDMHRHAPICTDTHRSAPICKDMHRYAPACTNMHRNAPICTHMHRYTRISTDMHRHAQTCIDMPRHLHPQHTQELHMWAHRCIYISHDVYVCTDLGNLGTHNTRRNYTSVHMWASWALTKHKGCVCLGTSVHPGHPQNTAIITHMGTFGKRVAIFVLVGHTWTPPCAP